MGHASDDCFINSTLFDGHAGLLERQDDLSRTMLVCTSGGGDEIMTGFAVDAISSPSRLNMLPEVVAWINSKMADKLNEAVGIVNER